MKYFIFFLFFAQHIHVDCGYTRYNRLSEAVLTSTHNLCFRAMSYPVNPSSTMYKSGVRFGMDHTDELS